MTTYLTWNNTIWYQSIFLSTPDMFVIPKAWATHSTLLQNVLLNDVQSSLHKPAVFPNVGSVLESHFNMIQARVRVFTNLTSSGADTTAKKICHGCNVDVRTHVLPFWALEKKDHY